jgi:hypothetical protein
MMSLYTPTVDLVAVVERGGVDWLAVEVGAVERAEIGQDETVDRIGTNLGVATRHAYVMQRDVTVRMAAEHGHRIDGEDERPAAPGRLPFGVNLAAQVSQINAGPSRWPGWCSTSSCSMACSPRPVNAVPADNASGPR